MAIYYLTKPDPNYKLKGSRDPLGLQTVWKETAQQLIKYLSTVSISLMDFQTLCYTWFFQNKKREKEFEVDLNFFLRFEQACAYARYRLDSNKSFNGKDRVTKRFPNFEKDDAFLLGNEYGLLSNQRNYGIWGKYIRPFRDMKMMEDPEFYQIYHEKLQHLANGREIKRIVQKIEENEMLSLTISEIEELQSLFTERTEKETMLYREHILKIKENHLQNELYGILINHRNFNYNSLFELTSFLKENSVNQQFINAVNEIEHTEKLICPLNRLFRYLQLKPYGWSKNGSTESGISNDLFVQKLTSPSEYNYIVAKEVKKELHQIFDEDRWKMIVKLVQRNTKVAEARKSIPWMTIENDELKINSQDGGFYEEANDGYLEGVTYDNYYLLTTYLNLFYEIEGIYEKQYPGRTHMGTDR